MVPFDTKFLFCEFVKVVYPLKQGLKHPFFILLSMLFKLVKVVYPLKQGLKPGLSELIIDIDCLVKVVYPLKQGLKRFYSPPSSLLFILC